jgi:2-dehydropantoate 2-reductase
MDTWLKTHVAEILPTVCALFPAGDRPARLASDDAALRSMLRSIREGYRVLHANGIPITPGNHRVFEWLPESLLLFVMRRMVNDGATAIKIGHAENGRAEWQCLADEFQSLVDRVDVSTPSIDSAYRQLSPHPPAAE